MTETETVRRKPVEEHRLKVSISLSPKMVALLDERAEELDFPRSLIIQMALAEYFAKA